MSQTIIKGMNIKNIIWCLPVFVLMMTFYANPVTGQTTGKFQRVVIDAGHGGKDPGAHGKYAKEKDVVLAVALKLGNYIEKYMPEVEVVYTRKKDVFVPLKERAKIANKSDASLFISIHANYISNPKITGTETFALGLHRTQDNLEVAKKENSVIVLEDDYSTTYEDFDPNLAESYIIFELYQNIYLNQSLEMADMVQHQFGERVGRRNRGVKQAGFLVLREIAMPGVLVELGFLSNSIEEKYLSSNEGQTLLASGIYRAFRDYKNNFEAKNNIEIKETPKKTTGPGVLYRIQVASSKRQIKQGTSIYKKFADLYEYKDGKYFKYAVGESDSFSGISKQVGMVQEKVKDCFIIAFKDGQRISLTEAKKLTQE
ncbi:N-acetylmuramoyl-L-alanine amidase family protein [Plebeiibacterium marinum]|uniref:N-acetylmuramoyl-L-alanine amidase n=1 Tax=Plebeiibacterium marinum TaxID=2992111 RepID=A0AAE3MDL5_9BACT|nr:N-acetylmuramoyl-L-alanine amidase [Plebeiobacterium marinum]MCW3805650.1 N-acetylmuramoyl-L-alanine amidase [Plebeiobacterium marinum]